MVVEIPTKWHEESVRNWVNEPMNQSIDQPMSQWISLSMNQWINEATQQWLNASSQWTNEPMNQWFTESVNQWTNVSESINKPPNGRKDKWMDGWASYFSLLSYYFFTELPLLAEAPLLSATSSLGSHLSGLLALWAASHIALLYSFVASATQFIPSSSLCAAVTMRLAASGCNPAKHKTLWSRPSLQRRNESTNVRAALTMGTIPR